MKIALNKLTHTKSQRDHGSLKSLKESIEEVGLICPLTINQNYKLLAGRRRFQSLKELGWDSVECNMLKSKDELFDFKVAIEENLKRKPLTDVEVAASIKDYLEMKQRIEGKKPTGVHSVNATGYGIREVAKDFNISTGAVSQAVQIARAVEEKPELAKLSGTKILREERKSKLKAQPLPTGKYRVIYADPPWEFSNAGFNESAESHYPTMPTSKICLLPIQKLTTKETVLFLWATNAMLEDALRVCKAWGFNYKSNFVWIKDKAPSIGWFTKSKLQETQKKDGRIMETRYQKIKSVVFTIPKKPNEKNWVVVTFMNGTQWMPALIDLGEILSKIGKCEDIAYPKGKGYIYTLEFITKCFDKSRREIERIYHKCFNPNNL